MATPMDVHVVDLSLDDILFPAPGHQICTVLYKSTFLLFSQRYQINIYMFSTFGRSPMIVSVYVANMALLEMNFVKILRSVASFLGKTTLCSNEMVQKRSLTLNLLFQQKQSGIIIKVKLLVSQQSIGRH